MNANVFFCVEGKTELIVLKNAFEELFDKVDENINVIFRIGYKSQNRKETQGDITGITGINPDNIEKQIYDTYFKPNDKDSDIGWKDATYIIHIIDLDGTYCPDNKVRVFSEEEKTLADNLGSKNTLYLNDHLAIREANLLIKKTNSMHQKRRNIEYLIGLDEINVKRKKVKYALYYFSSNLDHYLYGDANLAKSNKVRKATEFTEKVGKDADSLINFFRESEFSTESENYADSWKAIKKGTNSLKRGTNVNLLIDRILESSIDDWI